MAENIVERYQNLFTLRGLSKYDGLCEDVVFELGYQGIGSIHKNLYLLHKIIGLGYTRGSTIEIGHGLSFRIKRMGNNLIVAACSIVITIIHIVGFMVYFELAITSFKT